MSEVQALNEREKRLVIALVIVTGALHELKERVEKETGGEVIIVARHPDRRHAMLPLGLTVDALQACFGNDPTVAAKLFHDLEESWTDWPEAAMVDLPPGVFGGEQHHVH